MKFPSQMFLILPLSLPLFPFQSLTVSRHKIYKAQNCQKLQTLHIKAESSSTTMRVWRFPPPTSQRRAHLNHNIIIFRSCRAFDLRSSLHHQDSKSRPTPTWWPPALKFFPSSNVDSVNLMPGRRDWYERKQCVQKREAVGKEDTTEKLVSIDVGWIGDERLPN